MWLPALSAGGRASGGPVRGAVLCGGDVRDGGLRRREAGPVGGAALHGHHDRSGADRPADAVRAAGDDLAGAPEVGRGVLAAPSQLGAARRRLQHHTRLRHGHRLPQRVLRTPSPHRLLRRPPRAPRTGRPHEAHLPDAALGAEGRLHPGQRPQGRRPGQG